MTRTSLFRVPGDQLAPGALDSILGWLTGL